jgi:DNA-binding LytR/AlgR family response regulator
LGQAKNFYQVSRSYVINMDYIERIDINKVKLSEINELINIPDSKRSELLKMLPIVRTQ